MADGSEAQGGTGAVQGTEGQDWPGVIQILHWPTSLKNVVRK